MWLDSLGGRKFVLAVIATAAGCAIAVASPKGLTTETVALLLGLVTAFNVSNAVVTSRMASVASPSGDEADAPKQVDVEVAPPQQVVDLSPLHEQLASLAAQVQSHAANMSGLQQGVDLAQKAAKAALSVKMGQ